MSNNGGHLTVQYNLRWSEELRDKILEEAKKNTRSMNQEIIARLEKSFTQDLNYIAARSLASQVEAFDELTEKLNNVINSLNKKLDEQQKYIETLKKTK